MNIDISKLTIEEILELKAQLAVIKVGVPRASTRLEDHPAFNWDWTKTNKDLSAEYGVPYSTVASYRYRLRKPKATLYFPQCKEWDWSKPDSEIARDNKCGIATVRHWRNAFGKPNVPAVNSVTPTKTNKELKRELWESLDWTKPDIFLCRQIGVTRERIRQIRAQLGKPRLTKNAFLKQQFDEAVNGLKQITTKELQAKTPFITRATAMRWCAKKGIAVIIDRTGREKKYPWSKLDFGLPNILLGEIWQIPIHNIARRRCQFRIGKPLFIIRAGEPPEEFVKLISDERAKAAAYYDEKGSSE